jgi:hypothetical protein
MLEWSNNNRLIQELICAFCWFHFLHSSSTHKTHYCVCRRILMLCMKKLRMTRNVECVWVAIPRRPFIVCRKQWSVNGVVQCPAMSSAYLSNTKSPIPGFNKMAPQRTQLTNLWNFLNEVFGERAISTNLWPPTLAVSHSTTLLSVGRSEVCSVTWSATDT